MGLKREKLCFISTKSTLYWASCYHEGKIAARTILSQETFIRKPWQNDTHHWSGSSEFVCEVMTWVAQRNHSGTERKQFTPTTALRNGGIEGMDLASWSSPSPI